MWRLAGSQAARAGTGRNEITPSSGANQRAAATQAPGNRRRVGRHARGNEGVGRFVGSLPCFPKSVAALSPLVNRPGPLAAKTGVEETAPRRTLLVQWINKAIITRKVCPVNSPG